jgi:transposase
MGGQMEIITGVERRRRWRVGDKLRILAELDEPGVKFNDVALRHDLSRGLLWQWRDAQRSGQLVEDAPVFLPVRVAMDHQPRPASPSVPASGGRPPRRDRAGTDRGDVAGWGGAAHRRRRQHGDASRGACGVARMIPVPAGVRVWLAVGQTDMRRGMNGLALQVQQALQRDPHAGDLYVFRGKRGDLVKILWHDGLGMSLYAKRLERGRFIWPSPTDGAVSISAAQLGYMLDGIDWRNPQHTWRPQAAG